jgi:hypothetical protein
MTIKECVCEVQVLVVFFDQKIQSVRWGAFYISTWPTFTFAKFLKTAKLMCRSSAWCAAQ